MSLSAKTGQGLEPHRGQKMDCQSSKFLIICKTAMQCQWTRQLCKAQPAQHAAVTLYWRLQLQARTQQFCLACTSRLGVFSAVNQDSPYTLATDKRLVQSHQKLDIALRTMTYSHVMLPQTQVKYTRCQHRSGHTHNHSTSTRVAQNHNLS